MTGFDDWLSSGYKSSPVYFFFYEIGNTTTSSGFLTGRINDVSASKPIADFFLNPVVIQG